MLDRSRTFFIIGFSFIFLLSFPACLKSKKQGLPRDVISVISISGINKPQINRFILNCMESEDSLKLNACYFIVSNLTSNYTSFYSLNDSLDNKYEIRPASFKNLENIILYIDSLESSHGSVFYKSDSFSLDFKNLNAKFLTNNLFSAFKTYYNNKPYLDYNYETFKEYVLPYRTENEIAEPFRNKLSKIYSLDTNITFKENIEIINKKVNSLVSYDERYAVSIIKPSIDELLIKGNGNLESINNLKVKVLRSLGIAAAIDYTPALTDTNGMYVWTSVFSPDGDMINLDIPNGNLQKLLDKSIAKVYRRTFSQDNSSLFAIKSIEENTPAFLGHYNYIDVSDTYNFNSNYYSNATVSDKYLYLAVYNDGRWKPIDWSLNKNSRIGFNKLAQGNLYLPVKWKKSNSVAVDYPFIIDDNKVNHFNLSSDYEMISIANYSPKGKLNNNENYKIYYWDFEWKLIKSFKGDDSGINVLLPKNTIYRITNNTPFNRERIFSIENGKQVFY